MKKLMCIMALAATCFTASMAQTVTPLNVSITEVNLDSLRGPGMENLEGYRNELVRLQQALKVDMDEIKMAKNQLKTEQTYVKNQTKLQKDREKNFKAQEKVLNTQEKNNKKERKDIEKQRKDFLKNTALDQRTVDYNVRALDDRANRIDQSDRDIAYKRTDIQREREQLKNEIIALADYNYALQSKASELKNMETKNKLDAGMVKSEIKNVDGQIKEQKKLAQQAAKM